MNLGKGHFWHVSGTPFTMDSSSLGACRRLGQDTANFTHKGRHAAAMRPIPRLFRILVSLLPLYMYCIL